MSSPLYIEIIFVVVRLQCVKNIILYKQTMLFCFAVYSMSALTRQESVSSDTTNWLINPQRSNLVTPSTLRLFYLASTPFHMTVQVLLLLSFTQICWVYNCNPKSLSKLLINIRISLVKQKFKVERIIHWNSKNFKYKY